MLLFAKNLAVVEILEPMLFADGEFIDRSLVERVGTIDYVVLATATRECGKVVPQPFIR